MMSASVGGFGVALFATCMLGGLVYWGGVLRPYLHSRGITRITAPNWGISALSDWQMCSDHARKSGDRESSWIARGFTVFLLGQLLGLALILVGMVNRQDEELPAFVPARSAPASTPTQ
jgi:hypothetical protein